MYTIDLTEDEAAEHIAAITAHLPADVPMGRIRIVSPTGVATSDGAAAAVWFLDEEGSANRIWQSGHANEVTVWKHGEEITRIADM